MLYNLWTNQLLLQEIIETLQQHIIFIVTVNKAVLQVYSLEIKQIIIQIAIILVI